MQYSFYQPSIYDLYIAAYSCALASVYLLAFASNGNFFSVAFSASFVFHLALETPYLVICRDLRLHVCQLVLKIII